MSDNAADDIHDWGMLTTNPLQQGIEDYRDIDEREEIKTELPSEKDPKKKAERQRALLSKKGGGRVDSLFAKDKLG